MTTVKEFVRNSQYSSKLVSVQKRIKFAQRVKSDLLSRVLTQAYHPLFVLRTCGSCI